MNQTTRRNAYHINEQSGTAIFEVRDAHENVAVEFIADVDDVDVFTNHTWIRCTSAGDRNIVGSAGESVLQSISDKYVYADDKSELTLTRLNKRDLNFRKTNLVCTDKVAHAMCGNTPRNLKSKDVSGDFLHVYEITGKRNSWVAIITTNVTGVTNKRVAREFSASAYCDAKERAIYAAYLFEKEFYGDNFPEEEYTNKRDAFKTLSKVERSEIERALAEKLDTLRLARKKIDSYYQSRTLAAKLAGGEIIVRPDWVANTVNGLDGVTVDAKWALELEPEPEPEQVPALELEHDADNHIIKCSKLLLNKICLCWNNNSFVHVSRANKKNGAWVTNCSLPNYHQIFRMSFSENRHKNAKAMAIYAAYLFEKVVYGDNFPVTEYNRKLEIIKTLSVDDIKCVNKWSAERLERVYNILKEMVSNEKMIKPAEVVNERLDEFIN